MDASSPAAAALAGEEDSAFYVEPDCCMLCGVPEAIAPEIFETGEERCAVKRQPRTPDEIDRTVRAMWSSEVDCVRYRGRNPALLRRLAEADLANQVDRAPPAISPILRNRVRFGVPAEARLPSSADLIAGAFRADMRAGGDDVLPAWLGRRTVWLSWFQKRFHRVRFAETEQAGVFTADLRSTHAMRGLSWCVDDWLRANGAEALRWEKVGRVASERPTPM